MTGDKRVFADALEHLGAVSNCTHNTIAPDRVGQLMDGLVYAPCLRALGAPDQPRQNMGRFVRMIASVAELLDLTTVVSILASPPDFRQELRKLYGEFSTTRFIEQVETNPVMEQLDAYVRDRLRLLTPIYACHPELNNHLYLFFDTDDIAGIGKYLYEQYGITHPRLSLTSAYHGFRSYGTDGKLIAPFDNRHPRDLEFEDELRVCLFKRKLSFLID